MSSTSSSSSPAPGPEEDYAARGERLAAQRSADLKGTGLRAPVADDLMRWQLARDDRKYVLEHQGRWRRRVGSG